MPAHRAIAFALVLLLHLALIWLLLRAMQVHIVPPAIFREQPITVWLHTKAAEKPKPPEPKEKKKEKKQAPVPVMRSIGLPTPAPNAPPPASEYNGLRAFGRYLNNCSSGNYEELSRREWAHCLGDQWGKPKGPSLTLGIEPPSEWKAQLDKRKKPARKLEHECALGSAHSNLGLPCYSYAN